MRIEEIDKNFSFESSITREDIAWHDVRKPPFKIYGLHEAENADLPFHRLPIDLGKSISVHIDWLNFTTTGGRIRFATNSPLLAIKCETKIPIAISTQSPLCARQGFDLYMVGEDGTPIFKGLFPCPTNALGKMGFDVIKTNLPNDGVVREYFINMSVFGTCKHLAIGILEGSVLEEGTPYRYDKPVVFYGSSITQGLCASRPGATYEALLSAEFGFDYINLGFSGNAKGEDAMIEYLASLDPLVFVSDYDHNAPTAEHLQATLPKLYEAVRAAHPNLPFIFMSSPGMGTGRAKHDVVENEFKRRRAEGDHLVFFVDGATMYDGPFADSCTVDNCHPNDLGFFRMYKAVAEVMRVVLQIDT